MNNVDSRKIQRHILNALIVKVQGQPDLGLKDQLVRKICKTLSAEAGDQAYYTHFLPLVRAGLIECGQTEDGRLQSENTWRWLFSKPAVFYKDSAEKRQWIGFNLTNNMLNLIPVSILNDEQNDPLSSYIVTWETPSTYKGDGLPIRRNPSPVALLRGVYPDHCSTDYFARENEYTEIERYNEIYNTKNWKFAALMKGAKKNDGLYQYKKIFSEKFSKLDWIYYRGGKAYSLNSDPDSQTWARIMHCIDNKLPVVEYDQARKMLTFRQPVPILMGRVLFTNQMFSDMACPEIPGQEYRGVSLALYNELLRIFSNKGTMRGE